MAAALSQVREAAVPYIDVLDPASAEQGRVCPGRDSGSFAVWTAEALVVDQEEVRLQLLEPEEERIYIPLSPIRTDEKDPTEPIRLSPQAVKASVGVHLSVDAAMSTSSR
jgi:hypothetical protein